MSLAERINKRYLILEILEIIFCKKVYYFSEILRKCKSKEPKLAAKNFLRQEKLSCFLSKYETLPNKLIVLFSTLLCLIVGRGAGGGGDR